MKKLLVTIFSLFLCIQLIGCRPWVVRTSTSRKVRVDQEVLGNRGFILGKPAAAPAEPTFTDRKVYRFEVEIPQLPVKKKEQEKAKIKPRARRKESPTDKVLWGNRGYISGSPTKGAQAPEEKTQTYKSAGEAAQETVQKQPRRAKPLEPKKTIKKRSYTVRKGDTLQKISRKFYATTKKWPLLYKANRDRLKSPDRLRPGQVIVIPEVGEFKK